MAQFKLGNILFDRMDKALIFDVKTDALIGVLSQLSESSIENSGEQTEVKDKDGNVVYIKNSGKGAKFNGTNAMFSVDVAAMNMGTAKNFATADNQIIAPHSVEVKPGATAKLTGFVEGTVRVYGLASNGNVGTEYKLGTEVSATEFTVTSDGTFTPPTAEGETMFIAVYSKKMGEGGFVMDNYAEQFPEIVKMWVRALYIDPCDPNTKRGATIEIFKFSPDPNNTIDFKSEGEQSFSGSILVDYCSGEKLLYRIYFDPEDED